MKKNITQLSIVVIMLLTQHLFAQSNDNNEGRFGGSLQSNANFFQRDPKIGAAGTPQYDHQLFGAETWLNLNYSKSGYDLGLRFDLFNNSNLLNPTGSYTGQGIGNWYIHKKISQLDVKAGYIYDQIGSGIIYRAYEERPLAIDNALFGARLQYDMSQNWKIKAFTGKQKQQFESYGSIIKGAAIDGFVTLGDSSRTITMSPGFGVVNRTFDDNSIQQLVSAVGSYTPQDTFPIGYNTYSFSAYNTLSLGNFTWYVEGAYKSPDIMFDPDAQKLNFNGEYVAGKLVKRSGSIFYSSLSYAQNGLGITIEGKRTENFKSRTNPFVTLNRGAINFLPPMSRQNSYRLTARYQAATQELGEQSIQADVRYKINKHLSTNVNFSNITTLDNKPLYQEIYTEIAYKQKKYSITGGLQLQQYNQERYEVKPGVPILKTVTPYMEFVYKFSKKKALRIEAQYMSTKQDFGSWAFVLAEFSIAPRWIFTASDMYNASPQKVNSFTGKLEKIHYPNIGVVFVQHSNRFSLNYVKQVEGIVCTGGICRLEPAFSGVKMTVNSSF
jgi:hypothetical protein